MEEIREEKVSQILSWLQAAARGKMSRKTYKKLQQQKVKTHAWNSNSYLLTKTFIFLLQLALYCIQRTIRNFMIGKNWNWWILWLKIKPNLRSAKFAEIKVIFTFLFLLKIYAKKVEHWHFLFDGKISKKVGKGLPKSSKETWFAKEKVSEHWTWKVT